MKTAILAMIAALASQTALASQAYPSPWANNTAAKLENEKPKKRSRTSSHKQNARKSKSRKGKK